MSKTIYLIRHGTIQSNLDDVYAGRSEEDLTTRAVEETHYLGRELGGWSIAGLYASPLRRAVRTAEILNGYIRGRLVVDSDLIEMDLGPWTGLTKAEVAARFPAAFRQWVESPADLRHARLESLEDIRSRIIRCLTRIIASDDGPVAVVTHAVAIKLAYVHFRNLSLNDYHQVEVPNLSVHRIIRQKSRSLIERVL